MQADVRDPEKILASPEIRETLDFGQPIAIVLAMVLHFVRDNEDPAGIVARLGAALAPGSALILSHVTYKTEELKKMAEEVYDRASAPVVPRTPEEIAALLDGFTPVEPGLVRVTQWRPAPDAPPQTPQELEDTTVYGALALKP